MMSEKIKFTPEIERGNLLINNVVRINDFIDEYDPLVPAQRIHNLISEIEDLAQAIPDITSPMNLQELYQQELKRRLSAEAVDIAGNIKAEVPPWEQLVFTYGIPIEDLENLEPWLAENLDKVSEANERFYENIDSVKRTTSVKMGSEDKRKNAEEFLKIKIQRVENVILNYLGSKPGVKELFASGSPIIIDSWNTRHYFDWESLEVGLCLQSLVKNRAGQVILYDEKELLRAIGHEFFGHACNYSVVKEAENLPEFIRTRTHNTTNSTAESVAQYFELRFLYWLNENPDAQRELGLTEPFHKLYQRFLDSRLINEYRNKRYRFGIYKLAQAGKDKWRDQIPKIAQYSLEPFWIVNFINGHRNDWDEVTGRLHHRAVSELIYVADPVGRIMKNVAVDQVAEAERLILSGFWMPKGLEDWVRLNLERA